MKIQLSRILTIALLIFIQYRLSSQLPGMYVNGRYLYSATGDTVILKGFSAMIVYWDIHGDVNFPEIEKTGANCVRIFWNLAFPTPQPSDLDQVLKNCIAHRMIPIICLWDATGDWSKIQLCVNYWCDAQIAPILKKYEKYLIINIANEPGDHDMDSVVFRDTYSAAVKQMRTAGLHVPLIIDADRWGRNADAVLDNGKYILDQDPDHNLIFSWHLWDPATWMTGTIAEIDRIIKKAVDKNICFIVGEFGPCEQCDNCSGTQINWEYLIEKAYKNNIGYLPWVWKLSGSCHSIIDSTGAYGSWADAPWGQDVAVLNLYSIQKTSKRPSDLQNGIIDIQQQKDNVTVYPNPFSGTVEFMICLDKLSTIQLDICDIAGRKIKAIFYGQIYPGNFEVVWNSRADEDPLRKGIYFYTLRIVNSWASYLKTGKLIKI